MRSYVHTSYLWYFGRVRQSKTSFSKASFASPQMQHHQTFLQNKITRLNRTVLCKLNWNIKSKTAKICQASIVRRMEQIVCTLQHLQIGIGQLHPRVGGITHRSAHCHQIDKNSCTKPEQRQGVVSEKDQWSM